MSDVEAKMSTSARWFKTAVWPTIRSWFGPSGDVELHTTESQESPVATDLDIVSGIDHWVTDGDRGMTSIASRVQYNPHHKHTTFTIRYDRPSGRDTEYQKRIRQLECEDYVLPTYTVQAYVDTVLERVYNVAAVRTEDLYDLINSGTIGKDWPVKPVYDRDGQYDGEMFCVNWHAVDEEADLQVLSRPRAGLTPERPDDPTSVTAWAKM